MRLWGLLLAGALAAESTAAMAQNTSFELQLVDAKTQGADCSIVIRVKNLLGIDITEAHYEVQGLDDKDLYKGSFNLSLGEIKKNKERFLHFVLANAPCDGIARLHANGFTSCKGDKDYLDLCNNSAKVSSTIKIAFNDDATG